MRWPQTGRLLATFGCVLLSSTSWGQEATPTAAEALTSAPAPVVVPVSDATTAAPKPDPAPTPDLAPAIPTETSTDAATARSEAVERLKALAGSEDKGDSSASRLLREALEDRLRWLDEWDKLQALRREAEQTEKSPEREDGERKAELERVKVSLDQSIKAPNGLLPEAFQGTPEGLKPAAQAEMKEAIDATQAELKELTQQASDLVDPTRRPGGILATLRAERDKLHQICATLPARRAERATALEDAKAPEPRELARERLTSFDWEARVEEERLRVKEIQIALETREVAVCETRIALIEVRRELARHTLEAMQSRYRELVRLQQSGLEQHVAHEEGRAAREIDPIRRYQARRNAEMLALEARVLGDEQALSAGQGPSAEDQTNLADQAEKDFEHWKQLVEDGRSQALVALRLKNDYRRLPIERDALTRLELAAANAEMTRCEQELTDVELELIGDAREDRFVVEAILEAVPPERRRMVLDITKAFDERRRALLNERRAAREKLADRAQAIHRQILRRIEILDERYAFVRTNIFWVRDAEPIGHASLSGVPREFRAVARGVLRLAWTSSDRSNWSRASAPFALTFLAAIGLPWPLYRAGRLLNARVETVRRSAG